MRALGVRRILVYVPLGLFVWVATFESGIHATLAGVALALLTPAVPVGGRDVLGELEHRLHPWVNLAILPVFALANAGVKLGGGELSDPTGRRIASPSRSPSSSASSSASPARRWRPPPPPRRPSLGSRPPQPPRRRRPRRHRLHRLPLHHPPRLRRPPPGRRREARHPRRLPGLGDDRHRDLPHRRPRDRGLRRSSTYPAGAFRGGFEVRERAAARLPVTGGARSPNSASGKWRSSTSAAGSPTPRRAMFSRPTEKAKALSITGMLRPLDPPGFSICSATTPSGANP